MDEQNSNNDEYYNTDYPVNKTARRTYDMYQIAGSIQKVTRPIFKQKSLSNTQLITDWCDIIGHHYGNLTVPYRLANGTLTIACSSTTAAEMHYISNNIMQKINIYCGKPIVKSIKFISNRNALASLPKKPILPIRPPSPIKIDDFPHGPLQEALAKLGGHLQSKQRGR